MSRTILLDMDEAAYVAAFSTQKHWYVVTDQNGKEKFRHTRKAETIQMIGNNDYMLKEETELLGTDPGFIRLRKWISDMLAVSKCTDFRMFFNGDNNFRYDLATIQPYKGNRDPDAKPHYLQDIKDYISNSYHVESVDYLESDDLLSIYQDRNDGSTIIATQDKDLSMVPGWRLFTNTMKIRLLEEEECRYNFYSQILTGDSVDNIPGLFRVGPVTVQKAFKGCVTDKDYYAVCVKMYKEKIKDQKWKTDLSVEEVIYEIGNLLFMREELGEDKFWEPLV